jgi:hypothetical protein
MEAKKGNGRSTDLKLTGASHEKTLQLEGFCAVCDGESP